MNHNDSARSHDATFDAEQRAVLESVALGMPLPRLLERIVRLVESQSEGMLCSIVLLDDACRIHHAAAPSLPVEFIRAIDGAEIGPQAGSCGTAAYTGKPVIVDDIATHPCWIAYKHLALPHGLRACWSTPIITADGDVLGTFAMYYREVRSPTQSEHEWVNVAAHLALIAILRDRAEQMLRRSEVRARQLARLHAVSGDIRAAIFTGKDPQQLYESFCRIAVERGLAQMAWIALHDKQRAQLAITARFGDTPNLIAIKTLDLHDEEIRRSFIGRAIRSGAPALSSRTDAADHDIPPAMDACGMQSCAAYPFHERGAMMGIFVLCTARPDSFQMEETQVLASLASDLSAAVDAAHAASDRLVMEEALRAGEELRVAVLDNVQDAIFYVQVEGESCYRFVNVNRAFTRLFGVSDVEIVGKTLNEILPPENLARALARYDTVVRARQPQTWEEAIAARTGQKHGDVALIPILNTDGRCTNLVGTVHDITARLQAESERTKLQTQLHQAQRMQALGTLAGGIAHDFNNILAAIVGNTALALQDVPLSSAVREHLTEVEKASRRAVELVRQILTFSRSTPPVYKMMDPRTVTAEALKMLRATLPKKICIETHFAPDTPRINADSTQFHQVVMNLATNAAHAFNNGSGVIEVSLNRATSDQVGGGKAASQLVPGTYLRLRVMDRGSGMEAATLKQAFDPFFTTRAPGEGTGLGLSVVHGIVENHQGAIDIESEFGFGTTVTVYLPASEAPVAESQSSRSIRGGGERILYVDDEEPLVLLMDRALTRMGYRVSGYVDPVAALEVFRKQPFEFDVVITDLAMPGLPGPKLATELRKIRSDVPIIMTSGYIRPQDREVAEQLQINQLVYKSNTIEQLGEVLAAEIAAIKSKTLHL